VPFYRVCSIGILKYDYNKTNNKNAHYVLNKTKWIPPEKLRQDKFVPLCNMQNIKEKKAKLKHSSEHIFILIRQNGYQTRQNGSLPYKTKWTPLD
jgi:hypothetical protein